jgi:hypothetical protein
MIMSEKKESTNPKKGTELTKPEIEQINIRSNLIQNKKEEIQKLTFESQILENELRQYTQSLITKYNLDKSKDYTFNGSELIEYIEPQEKK